MEYNGHGSKRDYTELNKLEEYLKEKGFKYERIDDDSDETFNRHQIIVGDWDVICHYGSFGYEQGLLELMGGLVDTAVDGDTVVGYLTADDIIARIEKES